MAAGARVLVNITNDSWFGRSAGPYQHALINAMRAVENRTAIARAATSGISLFIDPFGRTYEATDLFTPAVVVATVPVGQPATFYTRHGDFFAWGCLMISLVALVARFRKPRPAREPAEADLDSEVQHEPEADLDQKFNTNQKLTSIQKLTMNQTRPGKTTCPFSTTSKNYAGAFSRP